ncbi:glycine cleavage system H protein [Nocardia sp. NPDC052112]|uniref:glycine cleavage system protein H n=1 Tax=Nocardia sp. NPDC052112 TaxID=3155646 RepID=UPI00344167E8
MSTANFPADLGYTVEHEWVALTPGSALPEEPVRVGITAVATQALGDLVYIDMPKVGATVIAGEPCGEVESTKSVSDMYSPVTGRVTRINAAAVEDPAIITADPYGAGWLFAVYPTATGDLMSAAEYAEINPE